MTGKIRDVADTNMSEQVLAARRARGWGQRQLAERAGVSTGTVLKVEHGDPVLPSKLRAITDALGITRSDDEAEVLHNATDRARTVLPESWIVLDLPEDVLEGLAPADRHWVETEARRAALAAARDRREARR